MALTWPEGWPRTAEPQRRNGAFHSTGTTTWGRGKTALSISQALQRVQAEVGRMGGTGLRIDTDLRVRKDGLPYSDQRQPDDPGAVVSFRLPGDKPVVLPCDRYTKVEQNLAAIAATLEAKRAIERHGVSTLAREFEGYLLLGDGSGTTPGPQGGVAITLPLQPHEVLGVHPEAPVEVAEAAYRALAKKHHPDRGGDPEQMSSLNDAISRIRARA